MKNLGDRELDREEGYVLTVVLIVATFVAFGLLCVVLPWWLAGIVASLGFTWTCDKIEDRQVRAYLRDQEARRLRRLQRRFESDRADWWR